MDRSTSPVLLRGNCLELLQAQPDSHFDLLLTDPPYGTTELDFDQAKLDWKAWWREIDRVCKPQATQVIFAAQPFATEMINANARHFCYDMIWAKPYTVGFLSANRRPLRSHELLLIFRRRSQAKAARGIHPIYNPQFTEGKPYHHKARKVNPAHYNAPKGEDRDYVNPGRRYPTSVLTFGKDKKIWHPTQKPLELCRWLVRTYSNRDQLVFDPFMGSGSTGVAALEEGRRFVGMELDARYFAIAEERMATR